MLICGHCGDTVKDLRGLAVHLNCQEKPLPLVVVENTDVQQLKAEIAALVKEAESCLGRVPNGEKIFTVLAKMRQLSLERVPQAADNIAMPKFLSDAYKKLEKNGG